MVTIGLSIMLEGAAGVVFGTDTKEFHHVFADSKSLSLPGDLVISEHDAWILGVAVTIVLLLAFFFRSTRIGIALRAVSQNPVAARLAGQTAILQALQASVDQARTSVEVAEKALEDTSPLAPFDGVIADIFIDRFQKAAVGLPIMRLQGRDAVRVEVNVIPSPVEFWIVPPLPAVPVPLTKSPPAAPVLLRMIPLGAPLLLMLRNSRLPPPIVPSRRTHAWTSG